MLSHPVETTSEQSPFVFFVLLVVLLHQSPSNNISYPVSSPW